MSNGQLGTASLVGLSDEFSKKHNKTAFYRKLSHAALLLVMAFLLVQFHLILIQNLNGRLQKQMTKWNTPLAGMKNHENLFGIEKNQANKKPELTFAQFWSNKWQKEIEQWFNTRMIPFRSKLIKFHNQVYYTVFLKSYMLSSHIMIGKKRYLFHFPTVSRYYNLSRRSFPQAMIDTWADELQTLADFFHQRGQLFFYIITPSKASYFPEYVRICPHCATQKTRPDYQGLVNTLKKRGFPFIDASKITSDAKKNFEAYLFPKGGLHWTTLAGAFATRELIDRISAKYPLPKFTFSYRLDAKPRDIDIDLAGIMNLFATPKHYKVPEVFVEPMHKRKNEKSLKITIIAGSFMYEIAKLLAETKRFDQIDFFFYWSANHYRNTPNTQSQASSLVGTAMPFESLKIKPKSSNAYVDLLAADIVILEENEANLASKHRRKLMEKIAEISTKK